MSIILKLLLGIFSGFGGAVQLTASPLYRSPYRNSGEAIRGDWLRIGKDIESTLNKEEDHDER